MVLDDTPTELPANSLRLALHPRVVQHPDPGAVKAVKESLEFHSDLDAQELAWATDEANISRYIRAEDGNAGKAAKRLVATIKWRNKTQPESVTCVECSQDHRAHDLRCIGHDTYGRPVLYNCFACSNARGPHGLLAHFTQTVEEAIKNMPPGVETFVWIADFEGFGIRDSIDPRFSIWLLNMFQNHYPERMGCVVCVEAPRLFSMLWSGVKPFMSQTTKRKINFIRGPELRREMAEVVMGSSPSSQWLVMHMERNRKKAEVKAAWSQPHELPPGVQTAGPHKR